MLQCMSDGVGVQIPQAVNAVKLSRAGGLAAWSVGDDKNLVCTDLTTGQTRRSMITKLTLTL